MSSECRVFAWTIAVVSSAVLLPCFGCRTPADQARLLLYCGAGIRPPVAEAAAVFGEAHHVTVECDFAGSETLLSRIKLTGRGDLYMPGDVHYVDQARAEGMVSRSETVCYFVPVMLVAKGNPKEIHTLKDLLRPGLKIALGDPKACAVGRQASKVFQKNGIAEEAIDRNVVFRSLTVNELGTQVKMGMVDVAVVWDAVAAYFAEEADVVPIPRDQNVISTVAVGVLTSSTAPELAGRFADFLISDAGLAIFRKHHYATELSE